MRLYIANMSHPPPSCPAAPVTLAYTLAFRSSLYDGRRRRRRSSWWEKQLWTRVLTLEEEAPTQHRQNALPPMDPIAGLPAHQQHTRYHPYTYISIRCSFDFLYDPYLCMEESDDYCIEKEDDVTNALQWSSDAPRSNAWISEGPYTLQNICRRSRNTNIANCIYLFYALHAILCSTLVTWPCFSVKSWRLGRRFVLHPFFD